MPAAFWLWGIKGTCTQKKRAWQLVTLFQKHRTSLIMHFLLFLLPNPSLAEIPLSHLIGLHSNLLCKENNNTYRPMVEESMPLQTWKANWFIFTVLQSLGSRLCLAWLSNCVILGLSKQWGTLTYTSTYRTYLAGSSQLCWESTITIHWVHLHRTVDTQLL